MAVCSYVAELAKDTIRSWTMLILGRQMEVLRCARASRRWGGTEGNGQIESRQRKEIKNYGWRCALFSFFCIMSPESFAYEAE